MISIVILPVPIHHTQNIMIGMIQKLRSIALFKTMATILTIKMRKKITNILENKCVCQIKKNVIDLRSKFIMVYIRKITKFTLITMKASK